MGLFSLIEFAVDAVTTIHKVWTTVKEVYTTVKEVYTTVKKYCWSGYLKI